MTKPRILLLTHYYPAHRGGVEISAGRVAARLAEQGFAITWVASDTDPPPDDCSNLRFVPVPANNWTENKIGIPYPLWPKSSLNTLRKEIAAAEIVHIHESLYQGNIAGARIAREHEIPYVVTQHIGFIPYRNPILRMILTRANHQFALPTLEGARAIVFMSEVTQLYFADLGLRNPASELIPFGVDTEIFNPKVLSDRESFGFPGDRPLCIYVGRFVEKKGLPIIRRLAELNPSVHWGLAGWGPIDPEKWRLPNVQVLRNLSGKTLAPLFRAADLFVMPSVGEGYPAVVQESLACGTPVLISTETAEGYSPAKPFVNAVPISDIAGWERTTADLISNLAGLRSKSAELVEFAQTHWSWSACADRYEAMILKAWGGAKA